MRLDGAIDVPKATKITLRIAKTIHSTISPVSWPAKDRAYLAPNSIPHNVNADEATKATGNTASQRRASRITIGFVSFRGRSLDSTDCKLPGLERFSIAAQRESRVATANLRPGETRVISVPGSLTVAYCFETFDSSNKRVFTSARTRRASSVPEL